MNPQQQPQQSEPIVPFPVNSSSAPVDQFNTMPTPSSVMPGSTPEPVSFQPTPEVPTMQPAPVVNNMTDPNSPFVPGVQPANNQFPQNPVQNTMPNNVTFNPNSINMASGVKAPKKHKLLIGIISAVVIVLAVLTIVGLVFMNSGKYSASDLVSVNTPSYTVSYPKQWQDLSNNQKALSSFSASGSLSDLRLYGYKYNSSTNQFQSLFKAGDVPSGLTNSDLQSALQNPTTKQQFLSALDPNSVIKSLSTDCQSISNSNVSTKYSTKNFIVQFTANLDCTLKSSNTSYHQEAILGFNNSKIFAALIITTHSDWLLNKNFYQNDLMQDFRPR